MNCINSRFILTWTRPGYMHSCFDRSLGVSYQSWSSECHSNRLRNTNGWHVCTWCGASGGKVFSLTCISYVHRWMADHYHDLCYMDSLWVSSMGIVCVGINKFRVKKHKETTKYSDYLISKYCVQIAEDMSCKFEDILLDVQLHMPGASNALTQV